MRKVSIELTPFHALMLFKFLSEFKEDISDDPEGACMKETVAAYNQEMSDKMTPDDLEEALVEVEFQQILGRCPKPD